MSTPQPNYVNPPTRGPAVSITSVLFLVLVTVSLVLRLYTRGRIKRHFQLDDIFATFGTILANVTFVLQIIIDIVYHRNRHMWDIPPNDLYSLDRLSFVYNIIFAEAACQSKLSLLFFARKMIGAAKHGTFYPHYIFLITLVFIVAICQILFVIISCVECQPLRAAWDPHPTYHYKCFNKTMFLLITSIINTLTDFLCTVLPALVVLKLQMPLRKRLAVASLFLVSIFVNIASALRIYYVAYNTERGGDTWGQLPSAVCSNLELGLGLLCVNLPVIRPLVRQCSKYVVDYMHSSITYSGHYTGNSAKVYHNTYGYSRRSNIFSPDSSRFTPATSISHNAPLHSWRKKTGSVPDAIEVLRTVELNSDAVSMSREYGEQNRSDELPLKE